MRNLRVLYRSVVLALLQFCSLCKWQSGNTSHSVLSASFFFLFYRFVVSVLDYATYRDKRSLADCKAVLLCTFLMPGSYGLPPVRWPLLSYCLHFARSFYPDVSNWSSCSGAHQAPDSNHIPSLSKWGKIQISVGFRQAPRPLLSCQSTIDRRINTATH